ncbi:MAG: phenylalanine--tRNA ligase subunit alpha, partial [Nannocystaceae bacterium]
MSDQLTEQLQQLNEQLGRVDDVTALYELQVRFLGKKGSITTLKRAMGKLAPEERKAFGMAFNAAKVDAERAIEARREALVTAARAADLARRVDLSMPSSDEPELGTLHPITQTRRTLEDIFARMGFTVKEGPHIE